MVHDSLVNLTKEIEKNRFEGNLLESKIVSGWNWFIAI